MSLQYGSLNEVWPKSDKSDKSDKSSSSKSQKKEKSQVKEKFMNPSYRADQSDMNYACKNFGICPPAYQYQAPPLAPAPMAPAVPSDTASAPEGSIEGFSMGGSSFAAKCEPLPTVSYSIYDKEYGSVMGKKIEETNAALGITQADLMSAPNGDLDMELHEYMQNVDMSVYSQKAEPSSIPKTSQSAGGLGVGAQMVPSKPNTSTVPISVPAPADKIAAGPAPVREKATFKSIMFEIAVFALFGIFIIFILEQIFRLGVMMGMKQTATFLQPFMDYAETLAD